MKSLGLLRYFTAACITLLIHGAAASSEANLEYDKNTIQGCTWWYDNGWGLTCKQVRDEMYAIPPDVFSRWNPSITLDCDNWKELSYCVQVKSEQTTTKTSSSTSTTTTTSSSTTDRPTPTAWLARGCYKDTIPHAIRNHSDKIGGKDLTVAKCQNVCWASGFDYAGVEAGSDCYCGDFIGAEHSPDQNACNVPCGGNSSEICGGVSVMNAFAAQTKDPLPPWTLTLPTPVSTSTTTSTSTSVTSTPTVGVRWTDVGCYKNLYPSNDRPLKDLAFASDTNLTVEACQQACYGKALWAGVENGRECWCGIVLQASDKNTAVANTDCSVPCSGDRDEKCGGSSRIHLYKITAPPRPKWIDIGCYGEESSRILRNMVYRGDSNTRLGCQSKCSDAGYKYSGVENANECWCDNTIYGQLASDGAAGW